MSGSAEAICTHALKPSSDGRYMSCNVCKVDFPGSGLPIIGYAWTPRSIDEQPEDFDGPWLCANCHIQSDLGSWHARCVWLCESCAVESPVSPESERNA